MAAPVIIVNDYTTFNAKVNQTIGADGDTEVASMLGKKLATSGAWEADKFPADDMGITDDNLSDTDTKLAQAEVFALSARERRGQRPAIDILRALASLPYGNDGELQIRSLTEALQEVELDTTRTVRDPITARSNVGNHGTALRPTLLRPAPHHRCRDTNWEWMRRTGYSLMMQRELAGLGEAWRQRELH